MVFFLELNWLINKNKHINYKKVIFLNFILSSLYGIFSIFFGEWPLLIVIIIAGVVNIVFQKEDKVYKYLKKLIIGSLLFGFLSSLISDIKFYIFDQIYFNGKLPFGLIGDFKNFCIMFFYLSIACFVAGILAVSVKGFFQIVNHKK